MSRAKALPLMAGNLGPTAGRVTRRRSAHQAHPARRVGSWLVWWTVLMAFWVLYDNSIALAELLAGAAVAAMAATFVEVIGSQAGSRLRLRAEWTVPALSLPGSVARDTVVVFEALWRRLARGERPPSGFRVLPMRFGGDSPEEVTRRALIIGGQSVAPNTYVLGIDAETELMVIHQLVIDRGEPLEENAPGKGRRGRAKGGGRR